MPGQKPADDLDLADLATMPDAPAVAGDAKPADRKASITYDEFKPERPDLDLMTEEEQNAMKDDGNALDEVDDDEDDDILDASGLDDGDDDDDDELPVVAKAAKTAKPAAGDPPAPAPDKPARAALPPIPTPPVDMAVDYAAQVTALDVELTDLKKQFNDGDIGDAEYLPKLEELSDKRGDLKAQAKLAADYITKVGPIITQHEEANKADWKDAVLAFKESHAHLFGTDHFDAFNRHVGLVTAKDGPWSKLPFAKQLAKAAQDYAFEAGKPELETGAAPAKPGKGAKTQQTAPHRQINQTAGRKQGKPVPTLAKLPASKDTDADGSRFAGLDNLLDGKNAMLSERALSRMTPEELDAYANAE